MAHFQAESQTLLENNNNHHVKFTRNASHVQDKLRSFRSYLRWMCVDQTTFPSACISWTVFAIFGLAVPAASHFLLACGGCDAVHERPFDGLVQLSMSGVATLSFLCLSTFVRRYGLRRFLFFDKLWDESETVRRGYTQQLNSSLKILLIFIVPSVLAESAYKIWWYASGASQIPFLGNIYLSDAVACILEICSWLYRTTVIFLVCVLFRLVCSLQILRLQDFAQVFHNDSDVASMLSEHLRIRRLRHKQIKASQKTKESRSLSQSSTSSSTFPSWMVPSRILNDRMAFPSRRDGYFLNRRKLSERWLIVLAFICVSLQLSVVLFGWLAYSETKLAASRLATTDGETRVSLLLCLLPRFSSAFRIARLALTANAAISDAVSRCLSLDPGKTK